MRTPVFLLLTMGVAWLLSACHVDFKFNIDATTTPAATVTPAPPPILNSAVHLAPSSLSVPVGDTITIEVAVVNLGMPAYTITLSPGAVARSPYSGTPGITPQPPTVFEFVDQPDVISGNQITLRAVAPGSALLTVSVSGEAAALQQGNPVFSWSSASASVTLTATSP